MPVYGRSIGCFRWMIHCQTRDPRALNESFIGKWGLYLYVIALVLQFTDSTHLYFRSKTLLNDPDTTTDSRKKYYKTIFFCKCVISQDIIFVLILIYSFYFSRTRIEMKGVFTEHISEIMIRECRKRIILEYKRES